MKLNIVSFITFCHSQPTPFSWSTILILHSLKSFAILNTMLQSERLSELCTWKSFVLNLLWRLPKCSLFSYKLLFNTNMLYYRLSSLQLQLQSWYNKNLKKSSFTCFVIVLLLRLAADQHCASGCVLLLEIWNTFSWCKERARSCSPVRYWRAWSDTL